MECNGEVNNVQQYAPISAAPLITHVSSEQEDETLQEDQQQIDDIKNDQKTKIIKKQPRSPRSKSPRIKSSPRTKSPKPVTNGEKLSSTEYLSITPNGSSAPVDKSSCYIDDHHNTAAIRQYDTVPGLKLQKQFLLQEVSMIDNQLQSMNEMKQIIKMFSTKMKEFSAAILKLERNRQGVPYVANVKTLFQNINRELNEEKTKNHVGKLNAQDLPFILDINVQFRNLHKICEQIIVHHVHYHVTYLENFHLVAGKLRGMMKSIVALYYTDDIKMDDFLDQSFDDLVIEADGNQGDSSDDSDNEDVSNNDHMAAVSASPRQTPTSLYDEYESPEIISARANESVKHLDHLRKQLREANQILGSIHRLSLGNPKIQSLRDYFRMVGDVLSKINLTGLKVNDVPIANKIEAGVVKMIRLSSLKRPSERHVEQMKLLLGEVDGRVYILIKKLVA